MFYNENDHTSSSSHNLLSLRGLVILTISIVMALFGAIFAVMTRKIQLVNESLQALLKGDKSEEIIQVISLATDNLTWWMYFIMGAAFCVMIVVTWIDMKFILQPIKKISALCKEVIQGNKEVEFFYLDRKDEIGIMAQSLFSLKEELTKAERTRSALDMVNANVMLANEKHDIIYMNHSVLNMLKKAEQDIRKDLPSFDSNRLLGCNVDVFHKNPSHQRGMLASLKGTYRTSIVIGGRTFRLIANPVLDSHQNRLGTVVEWEDATQELEIEKEVETIVQNTLKGELTQRINLQGKSGFMEKLGNGINDLIDTISNAFNDIGSVLSSLSQGDLNHRMEKDYEGTFAKLKEDTNATVDKLNQIVNSISDASLQIVEATNNIASGSQDLSSRTEAQAASLEEAAASMEELSSTVRQNSENAQQASDLASSARLLADKGGAVVSNAVVAMENIEQSSGKISEIINVIDEIAFQTNLLALNAAVEAARAGDAGKGFAVVAEEVRTLAQRSAQASKQIKSLIVDSNAQVASGVKLVNDTGSALNEIVESSKKVADIIAEIALASKEQALGIEQINTSVSQMDEMTQKNATLVEENSSASGSLRNQSNELIQLLSFFKRQGGGASYKLGGGDMTSAASSSTKSDPKKGSKSSPSKSVDKEWDQF